MTEVHHVDGRGHDVGVVYSEMQGVQNTQESLMNEVAVKMLYPNGIGFRYETGGMMDALRVLTADRIRQFHKDMYQPKNLCLVIVGEVDHDDLLSVLDKFEDGIIADVPNSSAPWKRYEILRRRLLRNRLLMFVLFKDLGLTRHLFRT